MKTLYVLATTMLLTLNLSAQDDTRPGDPSPSSEPAPQSGTLEPGKSITDSKGRIVENGSLGGGGIGITYTGKVTRDANGNFVCSGEISEVTNPSSSGSDNVTVDTNGEKTIVNLDKNGTSNRPVRSTITGGNAEVNVSGDHNAGIVGGTVNDVNFTGKHNDMRGGSTSSGGRVNMGGRGNTFDPRGGNWIVRN